MARIGVVAACVAVVAALAGAAGAGSGGSVDTTFADGGRAVVDYGLNEVFRAVAVQRDGKIVLGGLLGRPGGGDPRGLLVRLDAAGRPDSTFGAGGRVDVTSLIWMGGLAVQPDGRIVVAGVRIVPGASEMVLARFGSSGSPDPSFGSGGVVVTHVGDDASADAVALAPDGKIVVAGRAGPDVVVARYLADGAPDAGFGAGGLVRSDWGQVDMPRSVAVTATGAVVVAGVTGPLFSAQTKVVAARYTPDGRPDTAFAGTGFVVTDRAGDDGVGLAVQRDGTILLGAGSPFGVIRLTAVGKLDGSFGNGGAVSVDLPGNDFATGLAVQPNGKIVVAGFVGAADLAHYTPAVGRLLPTGAPDPAFDNAVDEAADVGANAMPTAVAVTPAGQIVVAGYMWDSSTNTNGFAVRFRPGTCSVPALRGLKLAAAKTRLARANCRLGTTKTARSRRVAAGGIVTQAPAAGREAADWAKVNVVVSRGR